MLQSIVDLLPPEDVVVYAPRWRDEDGAFDAACDYRVYRHPTSLMLPTPGVARRAARIIQDENISTVWFGAAAPLAVLAPAMRRAGATRVVATTHGHEVGWSMLPGARSVLRHIGNHTDVVTYVSRYTRNRFASAFGPRAALEHVPPGVDTDRFVPDPDSRARLRARYGLGERRTILCLSRLVPRKGQDMLIRALPAIRAEIEDAVLVIVGGGPYADRLRQMAADVGVANHVIFTGSVPAEELSAHHTLGDVFAMPSRTRGGGLDVEGLGIVYLEASATGVPVIAGRSGGAPETVRDGETGIVVDGHRPAEIAAAVIEILGDPIRAAAMGAAGRDFVVSSWQWQDTAARLRQLL